MTIDCFKLNEASEEEQLEAVKQNGWVLHYIKNPSVDVILFAYLKTNDLKLREHCVKLLKETKKEKNS